MSFSSVFVSAVAQSTEGLNALLGMAQRHPRRVMAAVGALLLGTGATAFAVATLVPDPSSVPVRQVIEQVEPNTLASANTPLPTYLLYRSETTRSNDSADSLLRRLGVIDAAAVQFIKSDAVARAALLARAGRAVTAEVNATHGLIKLSARWTPDDSNNFQRLVIERKNDVFTSRVEAAPLASSTRLASGVIRSSLFAATDEARIPDSVAVQLAEIFSGDIDFIRALRKGDRFSVVYESLEADGEPMRAGRVLSADFVNNGKIFSAVWFQERNATNVTSKGQYYTLDGNSLRKAFLASPLEFSRMTSGFGGRMHPIAKQFRMHTGVDYAAPTGTPIRSVGDGVVEFSGVQRGYGNVVEVKHRDGKSTLYAHMNSIAVRKGQGVSQGQNIGTVGSTGWSTGPHLHFEFRINGVHHDPLTLARQSESVPLSAASKPDFDRMVGDVRRKLAAAATLSLASAQ